MSKHELTMDQLEGLRRKIATPVYYLCHECACDVINADASGRDFYDLEPEEHASRDAAIEAMGIVVCVDTRHVGVFDCFVCDTHAYCDANVFEAVEA
ncbi:hypothetical protein ACWCPQ_14520 [Nocardia sp. NPDC001965]